MKKNERMENQLKDTT